ncbi:hypothetical protein MKEN_00012600 [Mycena kentingensis (nom. inval.)]|nr:hypothetical protein MKEN_00012600 [Mycena kentingensis (nom. inval.)]
MAYYYYDDYDPGPSYYDAKPYFYAPSEYDAYYEDPGPEPASDDCHPSSYDDAHGSPLYHVENIPPTPYDFLADEPLPDDHYEADYADPRDTDYDNAAQSPVYAADPYLAPYDFLADQPLDWEDDDDDFEAPYAAGFADDAPEDVGTPLGEELSCAGDGE